MEASLPVTGYRWCDQYKTGALSYHCSWKYGGSSGAIIFSVLEAAAVTEHSLCPVSGSRQVTEAAAISSTDLTGLGDSGEGSTSSRTELLASRDSSFRRLGDFVVPWTYPLLLTRTSTYHSLYARWKNYTKNQRCRNTEVGFRTGQKGDKQHSWGYKIKELRGL
jgi:hypothetical protein